jgi:hypothetical protein
LDNRGEWREMLIWDSLSMIPIEAKAFCPIPKIAATFLLKIALRESDFVTMFISRSESVSNCLSRDIPVTVQMTQIVIAMSHMLRDSSFYTI